MNNIDYVKLYLEKGGEIHDFFYKVVWLDGGTATKNKSTGEVQKKDVNFEDLCNSLYSNTYNFSDFPGLKSTLNSLLNPIPQECEEITVGRLDGYYYAHVHLEDTIATLVVYNDKQATVFYQGKETLWTALKIISSVSVNYFDSSDYTEMFNDTVEYLDDNVCFSIKIPDGISKFYTPVVRNGYFLDNKSMPVHYDSINDSESLLNILYVSFYIMKKKEQSINHWEEVRSYVYDYMTSLDFNMSDEQISGITDMLVKLNISYEFLKAIGEES